MPEEAWERRCCVVNLTHSQIAALFKRAGLPGAVVRATRCAAGKCSTVYRVVLADRPSPLALRIYVRDPASCAIERGVLDLVRGSVPVPAELYAETGGPASHSWAIQEWLDGERMEDWLPRAAPDDIRRVMESAGTMAARIHAHHLAEPGFLAADLAIETPFGDLVDFFLAAVEHWLYGGIVGSRLGEDDRDAVWDLLSSNRSILDEARSARSLVHSDYKAPNLLVARMDGTWRVVGVLDWEFAHAGTGLMDAGIFLRHERDLPLGSARAFARGYRVAGGHLPANWRRQSLLLDLVNLACMLDLPSTKPAACAGMRRCIQDTLRRWPTVEDC